MPAAHPFHRERDACGIGFVVNIEGKQSHDIIEKGLQILINLAHRGACGCDPETGDHGPGHQSGRPAPVDDLSRSKVEGR